MGAETSCGQVLEFLTVTSLPYRGTNDKEARRIVRSHAIRDANRRKRLKPGAETKHIGTATKEPPLQSSLTTKFKLNKNPPKTKKAKKEAPPEYEEWLENRLAHKTARKPLHPTLIFGLGEGLFDPFHTLPIKLGRRQQDLLYYRKPLLSLCHTRPYHSGLSLLLVLLLFFFIEYHTQRNLGWSRPRSPSDRRNACSLLQLQTRRS